MTIVEPHLYADTPLFREMLYEREGRFPGTPEGDDDTPIAVIPEPEPGPPSDFMARTTPVEPVTVKTLQAVSTVVAIRADDIDFANVKEA